MASREEEKRKRREEREAAEAAAASQAARGKRARLALGGGLAVVAVVAIVVAIVAGGGGGDDKGSPDGKTTAGVTLPERKISDLGEATKAAGCTQVDPPNEGNTHVTSIPKYKANPPTSGNHNPVPASDGSYAGIDPPAIQNSVHSLEHGRIQYQYAKGAPQSTIDQLVALFDESTDQYAAGQYLQVFQNQTDMPYAVAAVAWDHAIVCKTMNDKVFDAFRAFREKYTLAAPEKITQPE